MTTTATALPAGLIALPENGLACEACGVLVESAREVVEVPSLPPDTRRVWRGQPAGFGRCPRCQAVHDRAEAYLAQFPALVARIGSPAIALERHASALFAAEIIGVAVTDRDLGLMLPRLWPPAHQMWFSSAFAGGREGRCNAAPWAHVRATDRDELRRAYLAGLRDRVALSEPPVPVPCPTDGGGCLMCGVGSVTRSAIEVSRRGGVAGTARAVWRRIEGPSEGHLCPQCAQAVDNAGGAIGPSAVTLAALTYVQSSGMAQRSGGGFVALRARIEDEEVRVPTWAAAGGIRPNLFPWAHASRLLDI